MRTVKLVVIGASGVGKTSLRNQVRFRRSPGRFQSLTVPAGLSTFRDASRLDIELQLVPTSSRRPFPIIVILLKMLSCKYG
jgi:GTPase SAR1 family protein